MTGVLLDKARLRALTVAALLAIPLTAGCPLLTDLTDDDPDHKGVEGNWIVTHVDGAPLPPAGFVLEPGIHVRSLFITFDKPYSGSALGRYQIVRNGVGEPPKKVAGHFLHYDKGPDEPGTIYIFAYKERVDGLVSGDHMDAGNYIVYTDRTGASVRRHLQLELQR